MFKSLKYPLICILVSWLVKISINKWPLSCTSSLSEYAALSSTNFNVININTTTVHNGFLWHYFIFPYVIKKPFQSIFLVSTYHFLTIELLGLFRTTDTFVWWCNRYCKCFFMSSRTFGVVVAVSAITGAQNILHSSLGCW